jgi:hypothetical protein
MRVCARQFNIYLALVMAITLFCGCQTNKKDPRDKVLAALRVHLEVNADNMGDTSTAQTISVLRSDPVVVTIALDPILTEANIIASKVIDSAGGFAVEVQFDESATWILEQYSASNPGKHFVIYGQWGDFSSQSKKKTKKGEKLANGRWLAAPLITHRIANGVLAFTPDASREEADQLVLGLNNVAKINRGKK